MGASFWVAGVGWSQLGAGSWAASNNKKNYQTTFFSQHTAERLFSGRDLVLAVALLPLKLGGWVWLCEWYQRQRQFHTDGEGRGGCEVHMYMLHLTAK